MEKDLYDKVLLVKIRFWKKVNKVSPKKCWNWIGSDRGNGYGNFKFNKKSWGAHRFVWFLTYGEIPSDKLICHHCDNRKCVNPKHLFLGDHTDNIVDSYSKGRNQWKRGKIFTKHGTITMYSLHKCRCDSCKIAKSIALKRQRLVRQEESQRSAKSPCVSSNLT